MPIEVEEPEARILPIVILADVSGSMSVDGKIETLNDAISRMIAALQAIELPGTVVNVAVIGFGGEQATLHSSLTDVATLDWSPLAASGRTPMGHAFTLAAELLDDESAIPTRSYQPNLVLVSDGIPTDRWEEPLKRLNEARRAGKARRFAIGIGSDRKADVLTRFAGDEGEVVPVERVELLTDFFRYVTYTVTQSVANMVTSQAELPTFKDFPTDDFIEF